MYLFARWRFQRNFVSKGCDLKSITEKSTRSRIETILYTVLEFQFDRACIQRREANVNFGVSITTYIVFVSNADTIILMEWLAKDM